MAEQKYYTIVTDLGTELMAKAAQNGTKVNITHIAAGDGNGTFYKPTSDMTALKREIWRGTIQNYEIDVLAKNVIKVSGVIPKEVGHFVLREMALFDDKNNMIAVCNAPDLLKAVLEDGALTEAVVYMRIAVTNTQVVTIQVNGSAVYATLQELEAHKTDKNAHQELFEQKADKIEVETALTGKVDTTTFTTEVNKKANKTDVETALNGKVDNDTFTTELNKKADKTDVETALNGKVSNTTFTAELNKKVDKTDFTGANIGSLLEAEGWSSGTVINNIVDGEKEGSIKQINATVTATNASAFCQSTASGTNAFSEGTGCLASGWGSHAEGSYTTASGRSSHAEGYGYTAANGTVHNVIASGEGSHAEGWLTKASGMASHAEGRETEAKGDGAHAQGCGATAKGDCSHAGGYATTANAYQMVIGHINVEKDGGNTGGNGLDHTTGSAFIIGNGKSASPTAIKSNCFRVQFNGATYASAAYNSSGADYAELFQWLDDNTNNEDRAGLFVTLKGKKICIAQPTDSYILGIVSVNPSVVGDVHDDQWNKIYLTDVFGRILFEEIAVDGCKRKVPKLNPNYDNTKEYIPRSARPEWAAIGMLGKLVVVDDGSCIMEGFCTVGNGGIATKAHDNKGYYVMARLDENHIQILFR